MPVMMTCPFCGRGYIKTPEDVVPDPDCPCAICRQSGTTDAGAPLKNPPSVGDLREHVPDAGVVLHRILGALYCEGPDTEWNADTWEGLKGILDDARLTYDDWPDVSPGPAGVADVDAADT